MNRVGIDGESYEPRNWRRAGYVLLIAVGYLLTLWMAWGAGVEHTSTLALQAYAREEQQRALMWPMVEQMERTLAVVRDLDVRAYHMVRAGLPADVRSVLEEVDP